MTLSTIQPMGKRPYAMPYAAVPSAMRTGMPKTETAIASAVARPSSAATWAFTRRTASVPRRTSTGSAAHAVDSTTLCRGS